MKRGFIRCVWGIYDNSHRITARRQKIDRDINRIKNNKFNEPFVVYIYGKDNYERLSKEGFDCKLIDENPAPFDLIKHQYRHKMELIKYAMEVDGYDEIVYLDWDCDPQKKLPSDFWDKCGKRGPIQGCLQQYHKMKCHWRFSNKRKVINGGCLYIRDKMIPRKAIEYWETMPQDNDEPAWSLFIDKMDNLFCTENWRNTELSMQHFWDNYEMMYCGIWKGCPYSKELIEKKDVCFIHFI